MSGSESAAPSGSVWFAKVMRDVRRRQVERIRKAGKHVCVAVSSGEISRVTGGGNAVLRVQGLRARHDAQQMHEELK